MIKKTFFNIGLTYDMIAQAYQANESHDSYCFIIAPPSSSIPNGFIINEAFINEDNHLIVDYVNDSGYDVTFYINNGILYARFMKGEMVMALVDLGNVVGPQGATGATGPQGPKGDTGATGADGISPTFVLGDGTGGTTSGHLYADYDNPYVPS